MSRLLLFALIAAALAACTNRDGPYGYGYAVNDRPSLAQLGMASDDSAANSFRSVARQEAAAP